MFINLPALIITCFAIWAYIDKNFNGAIFNLLLVIIVYLVNILTEIKLLRLTRK